MPGSSLHRSVIRRRASATPPDRVAPLARVARPVVPALVVLALAGVVACGGGSGDGPSGPAPAPQENPQFRAIAGVSMGAYGALNVGTKHRDVFGTVAALGGPVDLRQLLADTQNDGLEVKPTTGKPARVGDDYTFDHFPPYPGRDQQISLLRDLFIAFGNPFLHHPDASRAFFAADSEPAQIRRDDQYATFTVPGDVRGFVDGGDANDDGLRQTSEQPTLPTDVLLVANGTLAGIAGVEPQAVVGGRALADLDGDGVYDVGDGIVVNASEPLHEQNGNLVYEPQLGETFDDVGLDGVAGTADTADFGEGNGAFDYDPDRDSWLEEDPTSRMVGTDAAEITRQRIYLDVGTEDEFHFGRHYDNLVAVLESKGIPVQVREGYQGDCTDIAKPDAPFYLLRYPGGHVGIPESDGVLDDLLNGDVCNAAGIWERLTSVLGYLDRSFPDGNYGIGKVIDIDFGDFDFGEIDVRGDIVERDIAAPTLALDAGAEVPTQHVVVYTPPKFSNTSASFPIVYFLGGYGQKPEDYKRARDLLDLLIASDQLQNMFVAFLPGAGGQKGSFYVNHRVGEANIPDVVGPTSGRYEDVILNDLIPAIETDIARGRIKR